MKNDCVFCAIDAHEIPSFQIYSDDVVVAFMDVNPCARGHVLVVSHVHTPTLLACPAELLQQIIVRVQRVAQHVQQVLGCAGVNILQNNGSAAGQSVNHLHFHIIPREVGDEPLTFKSQKGDLKTLEKLAQKLKF